MTLLQKRNAKAQRESRTSRKGKAFKDESENLSFLLTQRREDAEKKRFKS